MAYDDPKPEDPVVFTTELHNAIQRDIAANSRRIDGTIELLERAVTGMSRLAEQVEQLAMSQLRALERIERLEQRADIRRMSDARRSPDPAG